jgi:hypothetical protein
MPAKYIQIQSGWRDLFPSAKKTIAKKSHWHNWGTLNLYAHFEFP